MEKFFICEHCHNLVGFIDNKGPALFCCGEKMKALTPNSKEAAGEKHLPVAKTEGKNLTVTVGSVNHPMTDEHHISWIYVETDCGGHRKRLPNAGEPTAIFEFSNEKPVSVYSYCNLHGLWKTQL